ncbi:HlyD family efflux transporter periplasmic adaptor subunit [Crocosphaera chwakensis]|uniref:ABC-transporter DevB-like protein n=1 Tax=Crocosphaera chwakensis CCY0110 TaxID=391612 RepID=A3IN09_9CHRO|nr:HlyD family efflux transporter periplasmic adaptor subunit [Crocosphaera chwakensis]EAZ92262.1 ABC-transporter DevB-like protein [Crocosphaera chwakensis CCY0110]
MGQAIEFKKTLLSKKGKPWVIAVSILGVALMGVTTFYLLNLSRNESQQSEISTSIKQPEVETISALGRLEPLGEVIHLAPPPTQGGAKIEQLLVQEGDRVKIGQTLAILDNIDSKKAAFKAAQEEVKVAQANLEIVKAGAKQGEIEAQKATIQQLEAELKGELTTNQATIAQLEMELDGEKRQQTATIERLKAELKDAQREYQRYKNLAGNGVISQSELEQRELELEQAQESLKEGQERLNKTINTLQEQIAAESSQSNKEINSLNQQIIAAKANLNRIAEIRPVDVQKAQAELDRAMAQLEEKQTDLDLAYIKSPLDGQVLKIHTYPGEKVDDNNGILELGKTEQMMVVAEVYESEINQVRIGQKAIIKSDNNSFVGTLEGTVNKIGLQIGKKDVLDTDPAADVDVRVVEVDILLTPESSAKVSGLTYAKVITEIQL